MLLRFLPTMIVLVTMMITCAGCETVETTVLIGEPARGQVEGWTGIWQVGDTVVHLRGEPDGTLRGATVIWDDDEDDFRLENVTGQVTALGDLHFLHLLAAPANADSKPEGADPQDGASDETRYGFLLIEHPEPDVLVLHGSNAPAFRKAVEAGDLEGEVIRTAQGTDEEIGRPRSTILRDKASLESFLTRTPLTELFDYENTIRLKRLESLTTPNGSEDASAAEGTDQETSEP